MFGGKKDKENQRGSQINYRFSLSCGQHDLDYFSCRSRLLKTNGCLLPQCSFIPPGWEKEQAAGSCSDKEGLGWWQATIGEQAIPSPRLYGHLRENLMLSPNTGTLCKYLISLATGKMAPGCNTAWRVRARTHKPCKSTPGASVSDGAKGRKQAKCSQMIFEALKSCSSKDGIP